MTAQFARTNGSKQGPMPGQQAQGIVGNAAAGAQQDHGNGLMRNLVETPCECFFATRKVQAAVDHAQLTAFQPNQAMPVRVRHAGGFQP